MHVSHSLLLMVLLLPIGAMADSHAPVSETKPQPTENIEQSEAERLQAEQQQKQQNALDSLANIQEALQDKLKVQEELQQQLKSADPSVKPELQEKLTQITDELKKLRQSFEQVAIGGINLEAFGKEEAFDWKKELVLVTQPVLESLKGLTEKPRKIERLKNIISERNQQSTEIEKALSTGASSGTPSLYY